jgi:MoCo/4Fe-4S cofactor protein with predicted Tat translocation signal
MDGMRDKKHFDLDKQQNEHKSSLPILPDHAQHDHTELTSPEHEHEHQPEDLTVRETTLDLAGVRAKLKGKTGKQYWRTLEELSGDPHFEDFLHREFPRQASEWDESFDRRNFLKLAAASLAFAGISGCNPVHDTIVPYVKQPDGMVLGKPQFYATAMPFGADAIGLLVESHEGRPTHITGNPDHPSSAGGTDPIVQASVLNLYDPHRAQTVNRMGEIR